MTEITAKMVADLREKSGAGMMDCKKALVETKGDPEAAMDFLRKKGLATAAKKSGRAAAQGLVSAASDGNFGVVLELNAETDFVSRNEDFQKFLKDVTALALKNKVDCVDKLKGMQLDGKTVEETLTGLIATIGENMNLRRLQALKVSQGVVANYVHGALIPGCGKIGVIVALESTGKAEVLAALGKQIAMHIAATRPESLDVVSLDKELIARERAFHAEKAQESKKPPEIIEKMVEGSLRKFYERVVLLEQVFVIDGQTKISAVLEQAAKDAGAPVKLAGYACFQLGEGVEKSNGDDFAAEVAKMAAAG